VLEIVLAYCPDIPFINASPLSSPCDDIYIDSSPISMLKSSSE
jgi:hypothetical protein